MRLNFAAATVLGLLFALGSSLLAANEGSETDWPEPVWITSIAKLGDSGRFVASKVNGQYRESEVVSFDPAQPEELTTLYAHPDAAVWQVVASADGKTVASVDYQGSLSVFDTGTEQVKSFPETFKYWCQTLIMAPDNQSLVAGNEDGEILVWDLNGDQVAKSVALDKHAVTCLAISPDGSQLAASDGAGHVHLFQWPSLEPTGKIQCGEEAAWCVAYIDDGQTLLVGSADRNVYRCAAQADASPESLVQGSDWITRLAVSPSGDIAAGEIGGQILFPSSADGLAEGSQRESLRAPSGVWALCWSGSAQLLTGTRKDGIVAAGRAWKWDSSEAPEAANEDE